MNLTTPQSLVSSQRAALLETSWSSTVANFSLPNVVNVPRFDWYKMRLRRSTLKFGEVIGRPVLTLLLSVLSLAHQTTRTLWSSTVALFYLYSAMKVPRSDWCKGVLDVVARRGHSGH